MLNYNAAHILQTLRGLSHSQQVTFAAACTERLMPALERCPGPLSTEDLDHTRAVLDRVWAWTPGNAPIGDWQTLLADLIPDADDPHWQADWAFPQSALIALAHTLCVVAANDPQAAQWASNQVYEAADSAAQIQNRHLDLNAPEGEEALRATPVVQAALRGIADDLESARLVGIAEAQSHTALRTRARSEGAVLAVLLAPRP